MLLQKKERKQILDSILLVSYSLKPFGVGIFLSIASFSPAHLAFF